VLRGEPPGTQPSEPPFAADKDNAFPGFGAPRSGYFVRTARRRAASARNPEGAGPAVPPAAAAAHAGDRAPESAIFAQKTLSLPV